MEKTIAGKSIDVNEEGTVKIRIEFNDIIRSLTSLEESKRTQSAEDATRALRKIFAPAGIISTLSDSGGVTPQ